MAPAGPEPVWRVRRSKLQVQLSGAPLIILREENQAFLADEASVVVGEVGRQTHVGPGGGVRRLAPSAIFLLLSAGAFVLFHDALSLIGSWFWALLGGWFAVDLTLEFQRLRGETRARDRAAERLGS